MQTLNFHKNDDVFWQLSVYTLIIAYFLFHANLLYDGQSAQKNDFYFCK